VSGGTLREGVVRAAGASSGRREARSHRREAPPDARRPPTPPRLVTFTL